MTHRMFYIVRHGETDWNAAGRWQGQTDIPLNDLGRRQASGLIDYFRTIPLDRVIASSLSRAHETAQIAVSAHPGLTVEADWRWREFHAGLLEGKTWPQMHIEHPDIIAGLETDWYGQVFPEGESRRQLQTRVAEVFNEILADGRGQHVAIFTHGTTIRVLLAHLFPETYTSPANHPPIPNTAVTVVQAIAGRVTMVSPPHTPHL